MSVCVTGDAQPVARQRFVLPRHLTSPARPVMDPTSDDVRERLIVVPSIVPLFGEQGTRIGISTNVNTVAMGPLEPVHIARLSRGNSTSTTHTTEASTSRAVVVSVIAPTDPLEDVPPHSTAGNVAIVLGVPQCNLLWRVSPPPPKSSGDKRWETSHLTTSRGREATSPCV